MKIIFSVIITMMIYSFVVFLLIIKYKLYKRIKPNLKTCETCKWWATSTRPCKNGHFQENVYSPDAHKLITHENFGCIFHEESEESDE